MYTMHGVSYCDILDSYLEQYEQSGAAPPASVSHTIGNAGYGRYDEVRDCPEAPGQEDYLKMDIDSFLQQKILEQNCRRRRIQHMKLMLELSHSEDELNLDITRGAARANLDAMLFEEIDGDPDEQYVKITSGSADTRHSCRTPAGLSRTRYRRVQSAVEELQDTTERALQSLQAHSLRQADIKDSMNRSIRRNYSILFDDNHDSSVSEIIRWPASVASDRKPVVTDCQVMEDNYEYWLQGYKRARPLSPVLSAIALTPPKTPTTPPDFDDEAFPNEGVRPIYGGDSDCSLLLQDPNTPKQHLSPMKSEPPSRVVPHMDALSKLSFSALGEDSRPARPPPHPDSRADRRLPLSRSRFLSV